MATKLHVHGMVLAEPTMRQARLVGDTDVIDHYSDLYFTCMHECAHVAAGEVYGWDVHWPEVFEEKRAQVRVAPPPEFADWEDPPRWAYLQDAVISAVGPMTSEEFEYHPEGCGPDEAYVRETMRVADLTLAEIKSEARCILRTEWRKMEANAEKLYRQYVAQFADKQYAS